MKRRGVLKRLILVSAFSVLIVGIILIQPAKAIIVVDDHFDDGTLHPAWSITFQDATGWTFSESGTNLTVTDIDPVVSGGTMADVILSRNFTPLTDFHAEFGFSWDSEGSTLPMQLLFISFYDPNDNLISEVAYFDAWIGARGGVYGSAKIDEPYDSYSLTEQLFLIQPGGNYYFTIDFRISNGTIYLLQGRLEAKMQDQRSRGDLRSRRTVFCSIVLSSPRLSGALLERARSA